MIARTTLLYNSQILGINYLKGFLAQQYLQVVEALPSSIMALATIRWWSGFQMSKLLYKKLYISLSFKRCPSKIGILKYLLVAQSQVEVENWNKPYRGKPSVSFARYAFGFPLDSQ